MRTLVTGATGFIGQRLLRSGVLQSAIAMVRNNSGDALPFGTSFNIVYGDLLDPTSLHKACTNIHTIFHCAGYAHAFTTSNPDAHWNINFKGTQNLLKAAGQAGVKRFVFLSSVKAMAEPGQKCITESWAGPPITAYGQAKRAAEDAVLEAGSKYDMHVVNLRLAMVYGSGGHGNLERMAHAIQAGWFPPLSETGNKRSLVHIDDVIAAMQLVAEHPKANGKTYIIADPQIYSGHEIYIALRKALNLKPVYLYVPAWLLRTGGYTGDILGKVLGRTMPITTEIVERLLGSACFLPTCIEQELGWQAQIELESGLQEML